MAKRTACTREEEVAKLRVARAMLLSAAALVLGCASPGQPKPPSLHLPEVVKDLSAMRAGPEVYLRWTTSSLTTDKLPVPAQIWAVLCRQTAPASSADRTRCITVAKLPVHPGTSEATDTLPAALLGGAPGLLAYRIELFNGAGRSAGRSQEAFAASGAAPPAVTELVAAPIRNGVRLTWSPVAASTPGQARVELERVETSAPTSAQAAAQTSKRRSPELVGAEKPRAEVHLSAGEETGPDPGGAIDRSARKVATYRYVAERVQDLVIAGHALRIRSLPSAAARVTVLDTFPPQPPEGLEAAAGGGESPRIDLSWRPGAEVDLAGYNVYRREPVAGEAGSEAWRRLNAVLVSVPAYTDAAVQPGTRYTYRVTALDSNGNESAPGPEVQETPPTR